MRVKVDKEICQGHGLCANEVPEVFRIDEEGSVTVLLETPPDELRAVVADALRYCPTGAIALED